MCVFLKATDRRVFYGCPDMAGLVRRRYLSFNQRVPGSSPGALTNIFNGLWTRDGVGDPLRQHMGQRWLAKLTHALPDDAESQPMPSLSQQFRKWSSGVNNEVDWWAGYIDTRGSDWGNDLEQRLRPDSQWDPSNAPVPKPTDKVLDVGSGPLTRVAKMVAGHRLDLTAVDPLAPYYNRALSKANIKPPVPAQQAFAEDLSARFEPETFDFINIQNALDHSIDPLRAIEEMLIVAKTGGTIVLTHARNEAARAEYDGLHQWNFDIKNSKFLIWNKDERHIVDDLFAEIATMKTTPYANIDDNIRTVITKKAAPPTALSDRSRARLQDILSASLDAAYEMRVEFTGARHHLLNPTAPKRRWPWRRSSGSP